MKKEKKISITLSTIDYNKLKSMAKKEKISIEDFILYLVYGAIYKDKKPNKKTLKAIENVEKGIGYNILQRYQ